MSSHILYKRCKSLVQPKIIPPSHCDQISKPLWIIKIIKKKIARKSYIYLLDFKIWISYFWPHLSVLRGVYLSKAFTCMKFFLYKQKMLFYQGDGYLWPHCCMNNLYFSHRSLNASTNSFWAINSMLISRFWVTSWFYSVCNIVTRWVNFREKYLHKHELQLSDYNMGKYFRANV